VIKVEALRKKYSGADVLCGVDLEVRAGGLAAVLGLSGAGKSTLLRCLVGLERYDSGSITINGGDSLRGQVGLVFQQFELFPHLTVLENCILAPMKVRRDARGDAEGRARQLLQSLGMQEKIAAYPDHLSGGQRQRVAIAQQLVVPKNLLLMDEPFSGLDPAALDEVIRLLVEVANLDELNTIVLVTHDIHSALVISDTVFMLGRDHASDGKIVPGARIQTTYDLVEKDLAWRTDVEDDPKFAALEREVRARFKSL